MNNVHFAIPEIYGEALSYYEVLSKLLDKTNELRDDITNLQNNKVNKVDGKGLSTNDFTNEEKEKLSGLSNYDDSQLKSDLSFYGVSFDIQTENGRYIDSNTGNAIEHAGSACSDFISVIGGETIYLSNVYVSNARSVCCYREDNIKISAIAFNSTKTEFEIDLPTDACYIRVTTHLDTNAHLVYKNTVTDKIKKLEKGIAPLTLNDLNWTTGYYIGTSGEFTPNEAFKFTDYIPIKYLSVGSVELYGRTSNVLTVAYYDSNKGFISGELGTLLTSLTIPTSAEYMRICINPWLGNNAISLTLNVKETSYMLSGLNETDLPLSNIITDGGMCKIFRTIGVVGDSLSSGEMAYGDAEDESTIQYVDMYEYSWIQYMARYCGSTAYNFSAGGLSTRTFFTAENGKYYNELMDGNHKCQAYFIALGHNDRNQSIPIGTIEDINISNPDLNADTYYGNYGEIISKIKAISPKAKIFCILMKYDSVFSVYNTAIKAIASLFGNDVYVLDMATYSGSIEEWEYTQGHGNPMGYLNYSYQISSYVDWIIRHNRNDFKYVQFINTDKELYIPNN